VDPVSGPTSAEEARLEREYAGLMIGADRVRRQLADLDRALAAHGTAAMVIKGAAHILDLYTDALPRRVSDFDLIIKPENLEAGTAALSDLGLEAEAWNSPEDALLQAREGPGLRFLGADRIPVDLQTRLPGIRHNVALEEAWLRSRACGLAERGRGLESGGLLVLHPMHELLLAAAHLGQHLRPPLEPAPKWVTDMLLMVHRRASEQPPRLGPPVEGETFAAKLAQIEPRELIWPFAEPPRSEPPGDREPQWDWPDFWAKAERWGIAQEAGAACAAMNAYWQAGIPAVPASARPVSLGRLLGCEPLDPLRNAAVVPRAYAERVARMRSLSGMGPKVHYLWALVFPSPANLRTRYDLPADAFLPPQYALHMCRTGWKLVRGVLAAVTLRIHPRK